MPEEQAPYHVKRKPMGSRNEITQRRFFFLCLAAFLLVFIVPFLPILFPLYVSIPRFKKWINDILQRAWSGSHSVEYELKIVVILYFVVGLIIGLILESHRQSPNYPDEIHGDFLEQDYQFEAGLGSRR